MAPYFFIPLFFLLRERMLQKENVCIVQSNEYQNIDIGSKNYFV